MPRPLLFPLLLLALSVCASAQKPLGDPDETLAGDLQEALQGGQAGDEQEEIVPMTESGPKEVEADTLARWIAVMTKAINPYGSLRVRLVRSDGDGEVQNGSSRVGILLRRELKHVTIIGQIEVQVNLVEDPTIPTVSESTSENRSLGSEQNQDAFSTRLGWLGFDMGSWGTLAIGKQWSVYYDVTGWTDVFYIFGATALATFPAGTDGGVTGTGRAEQAIIWRTERGPFQLGLQYQAKGKSEQVRDSYAASLRYALTDWLKLCGTALVAEYGDEGDEIDGTDSARTFAVGAKLELDDLYLGLAFADQHDLDIGEKDGDLEFFNGQGVELYSRYSVNEQLGIFGGGNWFWADDAGFSEDQDVEDYYLGADWFFGPQTIFYVQGRLAYAQNDDALAVGLRYNY